MADGGDDAGAGRGDGGKPGAQDADMRSEQRKRRRNSRDGAARGRTLLARRSRRGRLHSATTARGRRGRSYGGMEPPVPPFSRSRGSATASGPGSLARSTPGDGDEQSYDGGNVSAGGSSGYFPDDGLDSGDNETDPGGATPKPPLKKKRRRTKRKRASRGGSDNIRAGAGTGAGAGAAGAGAAGAGAAGGGTTGDEREAGGDVAREAALTYLRQWQASKSGQQSVAWKFNKKRQLWVIKHVYDVAQLPKAEFRIACKYLEGLRGDARARLFIEARTVLESPAHVAATSEDGADGDDEATGDDAGGRNGLRPAGPWTPEQRKRAHRIARALA